MFGLPLAWVIAASVIVTALAGSHWKAYTAGEHTVQHEWDAERVAQAKAQQEKAAKDAAINERIGNELEAERRKAIDLGALSARRLRDLTAARSAAAAACSRLDEPAAGILPDRTRIDLESLADRADEAARQVSAWQQRERELGGAQGSGLKVKP